MATKSALRKVLRGLRQEHVAAQPDAIRALLFNRPPAPLLALIPEDAVIGLYHATQDEAPTASYAKVFHERGHRLALPRFADPAADMQFAAYTDPFAEDELVHGAFGIEQPGPDAEAVLPDVMFIPLIGFTATGQRLGQGGGHYDRWLADNPGRTKVGLAWDVQLVEDLPTEDHDQALDAIVTPTRLYGPFA